MAMSDGFKKAIQRLIAVYSSDETSTDIETELYELHAVGAYSMPDEKYTSLLEDLNTVSAVDDIEYLDNEIVFCISGVRDIAEVEQIIRSHSQNGRYWIKISDDKESELLFDITVG